MSINKTVAVQFMSWLEENYALGFDSNEILDIARKYELYCAEHRFLQDYVDPKHELVSEHQNLDSTVYVAICSCGREMRSRRVAQAHVMLYSKEF